MQPHVLVGGTIETAIIRDQPLLPNRPALGRRVLTLDSIVYPDKSMRVGSQDPTGSSKCSVHICGINRSGMPGSHEARGLLKILTVYGRKTMLHLTDARMIPIPNFKTNRGYRSAE